jgi:hypothetical protein
MLLWRRNECQRGAVSTCLRLFARRGVGSEPNNEAVFANAFKTGVKLEIGINRSSGLMHFAE